MVYLGNKIKAHIFFLLDLENLAGFALYKREDPRRGMRMRIVLEELDLGAEQRE